MIKTAISGACGRMGKSILNVLASDSNIQITGATEMDGHPGLNANLGELIGNKNIDVNITDNISDAFSGAEIIVDFTSPESTLKKSEVCCGKRQIHGYRHNRIQR